MKGKRVFALSMITLAVSQAVYAEVDMLPEVTVKSTIPSEKMSIDEPSSTGDMPPRDKL